MNFSTLLAMDARAFYLLGSFGAFALVLALEVILLRARLKRVAAELRDERMTAAVRPRKGEGK